MVAGGQGSNRPPNENFLGALKSVIANVKYYTKYSADWKMNFNIEKIKVVIFNKQGRALKNEKLCKGTVVWKM